MNPTKRFTVAAGILALALNAAASGRLTVVDSTDRSPLPAASIFNNGGAMLGITEENGSFANLSAADYPLTVRYIGYEPATVATPADTICLNPTSLEMKEVTVTDNTDGVHLLCYLREYHSSIGEGDTLTIFTERMVDYVIPIRDKVKKFKKQTSPRVLKARNFARYSHKDRADSVAADITDGSSWLFLATLDNDIVDEPESLRGLTAGVDTIHSDKFSSVYRKYGESLSLNCDLLSNKKDHVWSPNILKLLGMTIDFRELSFQQVFPVKESGSYRIYDMIMQSFTMNAIGRGKFLKLALGAKGPMEMHSLFEIYPVDCRFITAEESRALQKEAPLTDFIIPSAATPLDNATQSMIDRCRDNSTVTTL